MAQYITLNLKLSNLQLNKLKSGKKNGTEVVLKISSNFALDSNDENNLCGTRKFTIYLPKQSR